ncbi:MAG: RHS repeat-associated core domain-containing protein, partial [Candidatus Acidiferrales bacterium]
TLTITKHTSYIYNLDGSLQSLTYPSGNTVSYTMGGNGLPISVRDTTWGNILDTEAYTPWGAPSQALLPELVSEFEFYDVRLRPCWTVAAPGLAAPANGTCTPGELATPIVETSYSWSPNGDLLGSNNVARRGSQVYNYDQVNRIVGAQSPGWTLTFGVDQWGNLNSAVGTGTASSFTLSTDTNNHISTALFSYDASGNETHDATNAYTWNAESELLGNLYDGRGNRVDSGGGATLSWYGPNGELLEQTSSSPLSVTYSDFVYFNGARLARHDYQNKLYYYFTDQVNSTRVIAQGVFGGTTLTLCYDADFSPYGGEQRFTDTCDQNFKFDGKERDPLTGNDYFGARYYSSTYGRFLSPDWSSTPAPVPYANLSNPQTLNLYAFVSDNPESFADLDGHGRYPGQPPAPASPQACQKQGQGQCAPPAQAQSNPVLQVIEDTAVGAAKETANTVIDLANLINAPIDATLAKLDINFSFGQGSDLKASTPGEKGAMIGTGIVLAIASGGESKSVDAVNLGKALASEAQVAEKGSAIIGAGTNKALNQAARLSSEYGGNAADWSKMTSTAYRSADGSVISTHWYENVVSGIRAEYKSIIDSAPWK